MTAVSCDKEDTPVENGLQLSHENIDVGVLSAGGVSEFTVRLSNDSSGQVNLVELRASCPCLTATVSEQSIRSNEHVYLKLKIDLTDQTVLHGDQSFRIIGLGTEGDALFSAKVRAFVAGESIESWNPL